MANIFFLLLLRVSASVFFREIPWLMLLIILGLISVANFLLMFFFVKFREIPWLMLLIILLLCLCLLCDFKKYLQKIKFYFLLTNFLYVLKTPYFTSFFKRQH